MTLAGKSFGGSFALIILTTAALSQIPDGWEIREIAPAGTEYYYGPPDINDRGQIVFHRREWPSVTEIEIFLYDRGRLVQLTVDGTLDAFPAINGHGDIIWDRDLDSEPGNQLIGLVLWQEGRMGEFARPLTGQSYADADINDAGHVIWSARLDPGIDSAEMFLFDGTEVIQLTHDYQNGIVSQAGRLNQRGHVVFTRGNFGVAPWVSEVVAYIDGTLVTLADDDRAVWATGLNDEPAVVWRSPFDGMEVWRNGITTVLLAENTGGGTINNRGDITIARWDTPNHNSMLWLWRDGELIQLTDGVYGGQLGEINERGEVAFESGRAPSFGVSLFTKRCFVADLDFDGDVDLVDFASMQNCFGGPGDKYDGPCWSSDTNADEEVNLEDYKKIAEFLEGPE